jgi:aspartate aminotransferase
VAILPASDFYCPSDYLACRVASVDYEGEKVYQASLQKKVLTDAFIETHCSSLKLGCDQIENFLKSL